VPASASGMKLAPTVMTRLRRWTGGERIPEARGACQFTHGAVIIHFRSWAEGVRWFHRILSRLRPGRRPTLELFGFNP